jgi:hypothetical protein
VAIVGLLAVCVGWYWFLFWSPAGLPVPADAYRDAENGFALVQPEGWQAQKTRDCKSIGAFLSNASACAILVLRRETLSGESGPNIQVMTALWQGGVGLTMHVPLSC